MSDLMGPAFTEPIFSDVVYEKPSVPLITHTEVCDAQFKIVFPLERVILSVGFAGRSATLRTLIEVVAVFDPP